MTRDDRPDPLGPLIDDLVAEQHALDAALAGVPDAHWERPSLTEGWVLRDSIAHLAEGDARARGGGETRRPLWPLSPSPGRPPRRGALTGRPVGARARAGAERVDWWRTDRDRVRRALRTCAARDRLPWTGRRMRARSFATSRLAAGWSPELEALEAAGPPPIVTDRIRHGAPLGDSTRACADRNRGRPPPVEPLRVELDGFCQISGHGDEPGQALPLAARVMPPASPPSVTASV